MGGARGVIVGVGGLGRLWAWGRGAIGSCHASMAGDGYLGPFNPVGINKV